jgi:hypothetical protein
MRFIKPLDEALILELAKTHDVLVTVEENVIAGGAGAAVNEFLQALAADRDPFPNAPQSANWTSVGILAHESALQGGKIIEIPKF